MHFISTEYLVLMAATLPAYWISPQRFRLHVLLAASLVFYGWWRPEFLIYILACALLNYGAALGIAASPSAAARRGLLLLALSGSFGMLAWFKYADLLVRTAASLGGAGPPPSLDIIPVAGISFYTFQTLSYTIDVWRGKVAPTRNLFQMALYVTFFTQLVAGPIERASGLMPQLRAARPFSWDDLGAGVVKILCGCFKKLVLAERLSCFFQPNFANPAECGGAELAITPLFRSIALYFDFSAYTDIALGSARMFGIHLTENFRHPFSSTSPSDCWTRWHITLTRWVHDYLFLPLGGLSRRARLSAALVLWASILSLMAWQVREAALDRAIGLFLAAGGTGRPGPERMAELQEVSERFGGEEGFARLRAAAEGGRLRAADVREEAEGIRARRLRADLFSGWLGGGILLFALVVLVERTARNFILAMGAIGLWHGAAWNFVIWGALFGVILFFHAVLALHVIPSAWRRSRWGALGGWAVVVLSFPLVMVFFFTPDLAAARRFFVALLTTPWSDAAEPTVLAAYAALVIFFAWEVFADRWDAGGWWRRLPGPVRGVGYALLFYATWFGSVETPGRFEYFQF